MIDELLSIIGIEAYVIAVCVAAFVAWQLGLRDPFLLTLVSLAAGIPIGWLLDRVPPLRRRRAARKR